ncbi:MAG TPA: hypothetical protein VEA19_02985 [Actinomycetota bacterium]|nr:hypothetical protein [Actinomycetota bacterium]
MAIKGKRRSKGGSRTVAVPPRRPLVTPPTPLLKRTGVRVALSVMLLAVLGVLTWAILNARKEGREREAAQQTAVEYQTRVTAALSAKGVGQNTGTSFVLLPEFSQVVSQIQNDQVKAADVKPKIEAWTKDTTEAATKIGAINLGSGETATSLSQVSNLLRQSLMLYVGMVKTLGTAVDLEKPQRDALATAVMEQIPAASAVFDTGWQQLQTLRSDLGVPAPVPEAPAGGGFPGGVVPPGQGGVQIPGQVPST